MLKGQSQINPRTVTGLKWVFIKVDSTLVRWTEWTHWLSKSGRNLALIKSGMLSTTTMPSLCVHWGWSIIWTSVSLGWDSSEPDLSASLWPPGHVPELFSYWLACCLQPDRHGSDLQHPLSSEALTVMFYPNQSLAFSLNLISIFHAFVSRHFHYRRLPLGLTWSLSPKTGWSKALLFPRSVLQSQKCLPAKPLETEQKQQV